MDKASLVVMRVVLSGCAVAATLGFLAVVGYAKEFYSPAEEDGGVETRFDSRADVGRLVR